MAKLVSNTYGDALFDLSLEETSMDELFSEVLELKEILKENPDFFKLMCHPKIEKNEKEAIMESVFKGRLSDELTGFLKIIINNSRYAEIYSILDYFIARVKEYKKIGIAYVTTPLPLDAEQKTAVEKKLLGTTIYEKMEVNYLIDRSIIGGMVIRIGDRVVDSSVKTKLNTLANELQKIQLARC
ncbi:MAG TPA: ATP synthase F1 subunit delta [Lachnospiraceae bacterium]|nr:ATP synthase F1 subunit delta [Lachnospiraceae bacterium]